MHVRKTNSLRFPQLLRLQRRKSLRLLRREQPAFRDKNERQKREYMLQVDNERKLGGKEEAEQQREKK